VGETRADLLVAPVADRAQQAELLDAPQHVRAVTEVLGELSGLHDLGLLVLPRLLHGAGEAQHLRAGAARAVDQLPDGLEVEAAGLELLDQFDTSDVLGVVEAGAPADLRRLEESARLIGADVAGGHAGPRRELVDRKRLLRAIRHRTDSTTFIVT
jgi:hypothetical protein